MRAARVRACKQQQLAPDCLRAARVRMHACMCREPPEVVWNEPLLPMWMRARNCGCATAGLARQSARAKQKHSNTTQRQRTAKLRVAGSYWTRPGRRRDQLSTRWSGCVQCKATVRSGEGVVKHQRALEMKCWSQTAAAETARPLETLTRQQLTHRELN